MNIVITGTSGVGKTTVCEKLAEALKEKGFVCGGVICPDILVGGERRGKLVVNVASGEKRIFASMDEGVFDVNVGRYAISSQGLDFADRVIKSSSGCDVVFIDELGPLEFKDAGLMEAAKSVIDSRRCVVTVVREKLMRLFLERFAEGGFSVFEVREDNRDKIPERIISYIGEWRK